MVGKPLPTSFDAGVPLRDVQEAASHADPRTTMRYDRARGSLDRHATYVVAAYVAGRRPVTDISCNELRLAATGRWPPAREYPVADDPIDARW